MVLIGPRIPIYRDVVQEGKLNIKAFGKLGRRVA